MEKKSTLMCSKCRLILLPALATFTYLNRVLHEEVLRCPKCGQVYLSEAFTKGKLREVETKMEDDFRSLNN